MTAFGFEASEPMAGAEKTLNPWRYRGFLSAGIVFV
jgi:hypothetical protein